MPAVRRGRPLCPGHDCANHQHRAFEEYQAHGRQDQAAASRQDPQAPVPHLVADARNRRDGKAIETIGKYHPKEEPRFIEVDSERAQYWLSVGAQPTEPVQRLLKITGDWQKFKGLPGAEGTLKVKEPKTPKLDLFDAALAAADGRSR